MACPNLIPVPINTLLLKAEKEVFPEFEKSPPFPVKGCDPDNGSILHTLYIPPIVATVIPPTRCPEGYYFNGRVCVSST